MLNTEEAKTELLEIIDNKVKELKLKKNILVGLKYFVYTTAVYNFVVICDYSHYQDNDKLYMSTYALLASLGYILVNKALDTEKSLKNKIVLLNTFKYLTEKSNERFENVYFENAELRNLINDNKKR